MEHDPTKWPTPIHGFRYWYQRSNDYEREVYEWAAAYYERYGHSRVTDLKIRDDDQYRIAIENQQFAERRANTFGLAAVIRMLEASIAETSRLNVLLEKLLAEGADD
jgi:hypothetical protein